jgi:hypothetical protein
MPMKEAIVLKNSGEALGGLNFGGGAMTTELTGG